MQETERRDHITLQQLEHQVQHQSSPRTKLCSNPGLLAFAAAAAAVSLFCCVSSPSFAAAAAGSVFARKTALFLLSNAIFILLAADCRSTASATAASSKQEARRQSHHQAEAEAEAAERCAVVSCVVIPCSASLGHRDQEGEEKPTMSAESRADEEQQDDGDVAAVVSKLDELVVGHAAQEEDDSVALELETLGVGEPTYGGGGATAQELDKLEIHELNKKLEDFIQSSKTKWMEEEEEASLLLQHV